MVWVRDLYPASEHQTNTTWADRGRLGGIPRQPEGSWTYNCWVLLMTQVMKAPSYF